MNFVMFLVFPICFGLIVTAKDFVTLFLGTDFIKSATLIRYLALSTIFIAWASVIQNHYLLCKKKDKEYVFSVGIGALVNIILNLILIPIIGAIGTAIATVITEFVVTFIQTLAIRKDIKLSEYISDLKPYLFKSLFMALVILMLNRFYIPNLFLKILLQLIIGILIYMGLNMEYLKQLFNKNFKVRRNK